MNHIYTPRKDFITGITNAVQAVVTFAVDHTFIPGEYISFRVSQPYGMVQINQQRGKVLTVTDDTVTVDIDTLNYNLFVYPVSGQNTPPMAVPSASGVPPLSDPPTVTLSDAFDNVRV